MGHVFANVTLRAGRKQCILNAFYVFEQLGGHNAVEAAVDNFYCKHARLVAQGLDDSHVDAIIELLGSTLREMGVEENLIQQVAAVAESTRNDVLRCH